MRLKRPSERSEDHLSPNRSTPTSAHLHQFCTCPDKSPPAVAASLDDDSRSVRSFDKERVAASSPRTPLKASTEFFRFSPKHEHAILAATRTIGTSPQKELKTAPACEKHLLSPIKLESGSGPTSKLEKASSVDEKKPQRNLRTTRSLSPRPPVRHQHAITVSDENDVTQVKLSPNDELDDIFNQHQRQSRCKNRDKIPEGSVESNKGGKKNRGLVYVPSDPWLLMRDSSATHDVVSPKKRRPYDAKSIDDPWELRDERKQLQRQSKSLSSKHDEIALVNSAQSRRPRLQRSKSPAFHDGCIVERSQQIFLHKYKSASNLIKTESTNKFINEPNSGPRSLTIGSGNIGSPEQKKLLSLSPTLGYHTLSDFDMSKNSLNLTIGGHHLLPRHSFSTTPMKRSNDELPLNIRRLSEQIREMCPQNGILTPPPKASDGRSEEERDQAHKKDTNIDALLETRC